MADEFVVWEDRFNVGIVMIDEQHRWSILPILL